MAEEQPSLHIDTDWKKQAQEEKRRLAEEAEKKSQQERASAPAPGTSTGTTTSTAAAAPRGRGGALPPASFGALVQSLVTQVLFYLGDVTPRGVEPQINLDMAKYNIDLLGVLEEKCKGNLTEDEQRLLDAALYEARMRYVSVASQYATV